MRQYRIKLSELSYEFLMSIGLPKAHMHTDDSDCVREMYNSYHTEDAKKKLAEKYGDVDLIITPEAEWYGRIVIDNEKWRQDHYAYCKEKAAWCAKYGCD